MLNKCLEKVFINIYLWLFLLKTNEAVVSIIETKILITLYVPNDLAIAIDSRMATSGVM